MLITKHLSSELCYQKKKKKKRKKINILYNSFKILAECELNLEFISLLLVNTSTYWFTVYCGIYW